MRPAGYQPRLKPFDMSDIDKLNFYNSFRQLIPNAIDFKDYYPMVEYSQVGFLEDTDTILDR